MPPEGKGIPTQLAPMTPLSVPPVTTHAFEDRAQASSPRLNSSSCAVESSIVLVDAAPTPPRAGWGHGEWAAIALWDEAVPDAPPPSLASFSAGLGLSRPRGASLGGGRTRR